MRNLQSKLPKLLTLGAICWLINGFLVLPTAPSLATFCSIMGFVCCGVYYLTQTN